MGEHNRLGHKVVSKAHRFGVAIAERGRPQLRFAVTGSPIHVSMVLMLALLAASPLEKKRFTRALPICFAVMVIYHVIYLDIAARCPYPLMPRPMTQMQLYYLNFMSPMTQKILANLNVFNHTVGWQLVPVLVWGTAAWKKWA